MERNEVKKIIQIIVATYPNFRPGDLTQTVDAWYFFLSEYNYNDIAIALKTYVSTSGSGFAPSASELIAMAHKTNTAEVMTEQEAWAMVRKAISNGAYHAAEEFEALPKSIQKAVGSHRMLKVWSGSDLASIDTVIASNFQRSYREIVGREDFIAKLPTEARARIENRNQILIGGNDV